MKAAASLRYSLLKVIRQWAEWEINNPALRARLEKGYSSYTANKTLIVIEEYFDVLYLKSTFQRRPNGVKPIFAHKSKPRVTDSMVERLKG
ncbi:MAG: hypothetical protein ACI88A_002265 [Paraglaciecola sp.]|jgi:hypothetical protein